MRNDGAVYRGSTRVHAVILTRDRPELLERCVYTALATLRAADALTVLDDSCEMISRANAAVLAEARRRSITHLTHLRAEQLHDAIARALGGSRALWQSKTAPRDIAPLRNLSLLISAAVEAHTTMLVDDDICGFDLDSTHRLLDAFDGGPGGLVAGAEISGMTEQDTVTRLSDAMRILETATCDTALSAEELFRAPLDVDGRGADGCGWVSAGYMAFRLPATKLFAFPPGYNEDWLWCLLQNDGGGTRTLRVDQTVMHDPRLLRRSTRDDILFELIGDLILDCFTERRDGRPRGPESILEELANHAPAPLLMPSVRVETLLEQARKLSTNGHARALPELESYGLGVLAEMLRKGDLEMDGNSMLNAWGGDAAAKHRSFAATLCTATAQVALRAMLNEGRL